MGLPRTRLGCSNYNPKWSGKIAKQQEEAETIVLRLQLAVGARFHDLDVAAKRTVPLLVPRELERAIDQAQPVLLGFPAENTSPTRKNPPWSGG